MTGVATFSQSDFNVDTATAYKGKIDGNFAVLTRLGALFAPHEQASPDMTVRVDAGHLFNGVTLTEKAAQNSAAITAPISNPRIDRIVIDRVTGVISVVAGTPAASPAPPAIPAGKAPIAQVALTSSTTAITNSMITDERDVSSLGAAASIPAYGITTNSGNDYSVTTSPAFTAYDGQMFLAKINATNTGGPVTMNANTLGAKNVLDNNGNALTKGALVSGSIYLFFYDGTNLIALNLAQKTVLLPYAADTGAANAYAVAPSPAISGYAAGQLVLLFPTNANTGASTVAVNGLTATAIKMPDGTDPPAGAIKTTGAYLLFMNGTTFTILNPSITGGTFQAIQATYQVVEGDTLLTPINAAWTALPLNTTDENSISGASRSGSTFTLPAGKYRTEGFAAVANYASVQGTGWSWRLWDVTNNVMLGSGLPPFEGGVVAISNQVPFDGIFTLSGTTNVELQYYLNAHAGIPRFGYTNPTGTSNVEAWAKLAFQKVG